MATADTETDDIYRQALEMPKERGRPFLSQAAKALFDEGDHTAALTLMREYAEYLENEKGDYGWAKDVVKESADWCRDVGDPSQASTLLLELAESFLAAPKNLTGWAASNFYEGAMCHIETGNVKDATKVLRNAYEKHFKGVNDFHTPWFETHLAILEDKETTDDVKLDRLASDFLLKNRDSWQRSCNMGIAKLARGKKPAPDSRTTR